jgi:putative glutamine amidotransferase
MPLLAICRGAQEANVALGGTLHQAVHDVGPFNDHRAPTMRSRCTCSTACRTPSHVAPGGLLRSILQRCDEVG